MEEMKNKKGDPNSFNWKTWIVTVTMIIQLLTAVEYYHLRRELQDAAALQLAALQLQVECLENLSQEQR